MEHIYRLKGGNALSLARGKGIRSVCLMGLGQYRSVESLLNTNLTPLFESLLKLDLTPFIGNEDWFRATLEEIKTGFADAAAYPIAQVYAYRGDIDAASHWLGRAVDQHQPLVPFTSTYPLLKNLREDPRFAQYLKRINQAGVGPS